MGGEPLFALNLVGFPAKALPMEVLGEILAGGAAVARRRRDPDPRRPLDGLRRPGLRHGRDGSREGSRACAATSARGRATRSSSRRRSAPESSPPRCARASSREGSLRALLGRGEGPTPEEEAGADRLDDPAEPRGRARGGRLRRLGVDGRDGLRAPRPPQGDARGRRRLGGGLRVGAARPRGRAAPRRGRASRRTGRGGISPRRGPSSTSRRASRRTIFSLRPTRRRRAVCSLAVRASEAEALVAALRAAGDAAAAVVGRFLEHGRRCTGDPGDRLKEADDGRRRKTKSAGKGSRRPRTSPRRRSSRDSSRAAESRPASWTGASTRRRPRARTSRRSRSGCRRRASTRRGRSSPAAKRRSTTRLPDRI